MTRTMNLTTAWQRRTGIAALGAALVVAATFGPGTLGTTRLGVSEVAGYATVTAADTITAIPVLSGGQSALVTTSAASRKPAAPRLSLSV